MQLAANARPSLGTGRWYEDAWYHPSGTSSTREAKLAVYFTDVTSRHCSHGTGLRINRQLPSAMELLNLHLPNHRAPIKLAVAIASA